MDYPTLQEKLLMTEYGRNVQRMVEYAVTIEDREERTLCVNTIIDVMGNLFPHLRDVHDFKHKLWDHVAIMSNFKLDIEYPYEVVKKEELNQKPEQIPYKESNIRYRHYGQNLEDMIEKVSEYKDSEERNELIRLLANQMKKCFLTWNKEVVDNKKILDDLRELSDGKIDVSDELLKLVHTKDVLQNARKAIKQKRNTQQHNSKQQDKNNNN